MYSLRICFLTAMLTSFVGTSSWADLPPDIYDPKAAFIETDLNADGRIDVGEFHTRLVEVFFAADTNKDGYLDAEEISRLPFAESLDKLDRDTNGRISLQEFVRARLLEFLQIDTNEDGELELDEVIAAYEGRPAK